MLPGSTTETYAAIRLEIDSWRWAGVPWVIRAGKGLSRTVTEAAVEFHAPPRPLFASPTAEPGPNQLVFRTKPDDQIIPAGKRIGLMIMSSDRDFTLWPPPGTELTIDLDETTVRLPVVGGPAALKRAFGPR